MFSPDDILSTLRLPEDWELIRQDLVFEKDGDTDSPPRRFSIVLSIPEDVITIIIYLGSKADEDALQAGWELVRRNTLLEHTVALVVHPSGKRKQFVWYCPESNATCMINFSHDADTVWGVLSKMRCH